jgi:hypothetical protein
MKIWHFNAQPLVLNIRGYIGFEILSFHDLKSNLIEHFKQFLPLLCRWNRRSVDPAPVR